MADSRLRQLERQFLQSGDPMAKAVYLRERVRVGETANWSVWLAAKCGHPAARILHQTSRVTNWLEIKELFTSVEHPNRLAQRIAIEACRHYRRFWNLRLVIEDPVHWIEAQGGKTHYWSDEREHRVRIQMSLDGEEVHAAVPFRYMTESYPGFNRESHWVEMCNKLRLIHFDKGRDYILNKHLWSYIEYLENRPDAQPVMLDIQYVQGEISEWDCEWLYHLLKISRDETLDHYRGCLTRCLSAKGTHEAINQGLIKWALI